MILLDMNQKLNMFSKFSDVLRNVVGFGKLLNSSRDLKYTRLEVLRKVSTILHESPMECKRMIPVTSDEFKNLRNLEPSQPENPHLLKVSILGEPNAGKSSLTNCLVKWKVCAVSKKVHTTRKRASAVLVHENKQIVFLDTPGLVAPETTKKHSLEPSFVMDPINSVREADLIAVVVDIANKWTNNRINPEILRVLFDFQDKKSVLILNKVDAMKSKARILSFTRILTEDTDCGKDINIEELSMHDIAENINKKESFPSNNLRSDYIENVDNIKGWPLFSRIFMVSALTHDGVDDLRNYLLSQALPGDWLYHDSTVTDQHPHDIALLAVREKLLEYLPEEIPYTLNLKIAKWEMLPTGCPKIKINVVCSNSRHKRFVIGPGGKHIAACVEKSRQAMREAFRKDVVLNIAIV